MGNEDNLKDLVDRLTKARVINLDLSLKDLEAIASNASATAAMEGEDWFCGTLRRRWIIMKPHDIRGPRSRGITTRLGSFPFSTSKK